LTANTSKPDSVPQGSETRGKKPEYPDLERSYAALLLYLHWQFDKEPRRLLEKISIKMVKRLKKHGCDRELESLSVAGCRRDWILWLLNCCSDQHRSSLKKLTGFNPRDLKVFQKNSIRVTRGIERMSTQPFGLFLLDPTLQRFQTLPRLLSDYHDLIEQARSLFTGHSNGHVRVAKALLVDHVKNVTSKYHDKEVSSLITGATNVVGYDETAHKAWRHRNYFHLKGITLAVVHQEAMHLISGHAIKGTL
jgi:hypothetical protein